MVKQPDGSSAGWGSDDALLAGVWAALHAVHDPEIPPCPITDLGIVEEVRIPPGAIEVDLLPTFAGCPALDVIREDVEVAVASVSRDRQIRVRFVTSPAWTSDRITPAGRESLRAYGLTPPQPASGPVVVPLASVGRGGGDEAEAECPFCGSRETVRESAFGPTLCRSTHYCRSCRNPFEGFKPKPAPRA